MVDVLNPEHTESKPLNTTELEAKPTATAAPEADAHATNHNFSAAAENPPAENHAAENHIAAHAQEHSLEHLPGEPSTKSQHVEIPAALHLADKRPVTSAAEPPSHPEHEEEMDFGALLESFEHEQAAQEAAQAVDGNVVTGTVIKLTDKHVAEIDEAMAAKEKELMQV